MGCPNVDEMLRGMESWQLIEWQAFDRWEDEMYQRASMQSKAEAHVNQLQRTR